MGAHQHDYERYTYYTTKEINQHSTTLLQTIPHRTVDMLFLIQMRLSFFLRELVVTISTCRTNCVINNVILDQIQPYT
jgi:hypothetical protein